MKIVCMIGSLNQFTVTEEQFEMIVKLQCAGLLKKGVTSCYQIDE